MRTTYDADVADMMGEVCSGGLYNCTIVHREGGVGGGIIGYWRGGGGVMEHGTDLSGHCLLLTKTAKMQQTVVEKSACFSKKHYTAVIGVDVIQNF